LSGADAKRLEQNIQLAESFDAEIVKLRSDDPAGAIARFATDNQITMILLGETRRSRLTSLIKKPVLDRILQETRNIDVVVVATHE
jgi:two-component system sensor histidine kinase KdpD